MTCLPAILAERDRLACAFCHEQPPAVRLVPHHQLCTAVYVLNAQSVVKHPRTFRAQKSKQNCRSIFWRRAASHAGPPSRAGTSRLGRKNQPHNPQAHLGCSRRKPRRDRGFHSPLTPRRLRVIRPNVGVIKSTPIRRVLVRDPRPPRLARSAAGTARRKRLPSQGIAAVTACLTGYYEQDFATGLGVFRRRKRPSNAHSHSTYHHRGVLRMLRGPHNTRPQSKGVRRNSLPDSRFFARLMTRSMSVLWPKSPQ